MFVIKSQKRDLDHSGMRQHATFHQRNLYSGCILTLSDMKTDESARSRESALVVSVLGYFRKSARCIAREFYRRASRKKEVEGER